jgi:hypothetical protein
MQRERKGHIHPGACCQPLGHFSWQPRSKAQCPHYGQANKVWRSTAGDLTCPGRDKRSKLKSRMDGEQGQSSMHPDGTLRTGTSIGTERRWVAAQDGVGRRQAKDLGATSCTGSARGIILVPPEMVASLDSTEPGLGPATAPHFLGQPRK